MIFFGIVAVIVFLELCIRSFIEKHKKLHVREELIKDKVDLIYMQNKGAAFQTFEKKKKLVDSITFLALGALLMLFFETMTGKENKVKKVGTAFMLGGAISNVLERAKKGYVVDYINIKNSKLLRKAVFNLADCCLLIGGILVVIGELFSKKDC